MTKFNEIKTGDEKNLLPGLLKSSFSNINIPGSVDISAR